MINFVHVIGIPTCFGIVACGHLVGPMGDVLVVLMATEKPWTNMGSK